MGYKKTFTAKITREKHDIYFTTSTTAEELIVDLNRVPGSSTVDEIIDNEGLFTITFHNEHLDNQPHIKE